MRGVLESWVTVVMDDRMGWEALVLAKSIKRSFTSRKLSVLLQEQNVSEEMKQLLRQEFHFIETIANLRTVYCGDKEDGGDDVMAQLCLWSLPLWVKCAFVASRTLVLESCEELFNMSEFSAMPLEREGRKTPCLNAFVFEPKRQTFQSLLQLSRNVETSAEAVIVKCFWKSWINSDSRHIKDDVILPVESSESHLHNPRPKIVTFDEMPWISKSTDSITRNKYVSAWMEIYYQDLLPQTQTQEKMREFLIKSSANLGLPLSMTPSPMLWPKSRLFEELEDAIAIVGMSCRFPGANNIDDYWNLMVEGRCVVQKFPEGRRTFDIAEVQNDVAGYLSCPIDEFDAKFFGISPREAPLIDPQQRLLLEVIWESLEDAGLNGFELKETPTGVFIGILRQDYDRKLPRNGYIGNEYHHRFLGNAISANIGRISHFMGFTGPNVAVPSGSSSSLAALHLGCASLRSGESNIVITGGVNLVINTTHYAGNAVPGNCRVKASNDAEDAIAPAEGVATLVLKRYADALNDGDNIRAIIRGSAIGNDGASISFGTPVADAQAAVCKEALKSANVQPWEVDYIETHGTGTIVGDAAEMSALGQVYSNRRKTPLFLGSVKTNIGHGESSAGIASIFKLILAIQNKAIPKNILCENLNPQVKLDNIPAKVPLELTPWAGPQRIGGVNSFSLTGTLVHVLLESTPQELTNIPNPTPGEDVIPQLITISARSIEALEAQRKNYLHFFKQNLNMPLIDVSYATIVCRTHFQHRLAILASDMRDLVRRLEEEDFLSGKVILLSNKPSITFLFTGQASQYFGMGKGLYQIFPPFKNTLDYCNKLYTKMVGVSLKDVLWEREGLLQETEYAQPAIFCIQISLIYLWKHFGIRPSIVLGHSVGEYSAAVCAGVISISDGLKLVVGRSRLVQKLQEGRMIAIKASIGQAEDLIEQLEIRYAVDVAAINSPTEVVISGSPDAIAGFEALCSTHFIKTHRLSSSHAFHSRHIDDILEEFGFLASEITYSAPSCTYISSTLGRKMEFEDFTPEYWQCHLRDTVQFSAALNLLSSVSTTFIEIGPQPVLLGLAMANFKSNILCCPSMRRVEENWTTFYTSLGKLHVNGISIDWSLWFGRRVKKVNLPFYAFQRQKFWFVLKDYTDEEDETEREGIHFRSKRIHPILGYQISTPNRLVFIQSKLLTELPYVKDCRIGDDVILPSGAVIELFLASAIQQHLQTKVSCSLLTLENITFHHYVKLDVQTNILTTIEQNHNLVADGDIYDVALYTQTGETNGIDWKIFATGQISNSIMGNNLHEELPYLDLDTLMNETELPISGVYTSDDSEVQVGKNYQRIAKIWKTTTGKILTKLSTAVQDPQNVSCGGYICFPTILDAFVETGRISRKASTSIISKISKFTWYAKEATADELFCLADADTNAIYLITKSHVVLAKLEGLEFKSVAPVGLPSPTRHIPSNDDIYTHEWRHIPLPNSAIFSSQRTLILRINHNGIKFASLPQFVTVYLNATTSLKKLENETYEMDGLDLLNYKRLFEVFPLDELNSIVYDWIEPSPVHSKLMQSFKNALLEQKTENISLCLCIVSQGVFALDSEMRIRNHEPAIGYQILQNLHQSSSAFKICILDSDQNLSPGDIEKVIEALRTSTQGQNAYAIRNGSIYVKTLSPLLPLETLSLPQAERLLVTLAQKRSINPFSSLQLKSTFAEGLGRGEVEVAVEACALNYRDLFMILRPDGFISPPSVAFGLDIAGRVTAISPTVTKFNIGDEVYGILTQGGGLASHIRISETYLSQKPQNMNFTSASTIPLTFLTAWKALMELGKLTSKDRVLVYLGIGGTGLAFIQICHYVGATVFALAGTTQRREYLKSIGVKHVYSSQSSDFAEQVWQDTNGAGITCVVNSFSTGKLKEANFKVCAHGAKFFEIGTLNIWTAEEARRLRPDVQYTVVNLLDSNTPSVVTAEEISQSMSKLYDLFSQGQLLPLPYKDFQLQHLSEAFLSFHKGKTIGKIVVRMPTRMEEESRWKSTYFNSNSTYLVTGDFSVDICKWMLDEGAEFIIVDNTPPSMQCSESRGHIERIHVQDYKECLELNYKISTLGFPPLRGVLHAELSRSTWDSHESMTCILHELTKNQDLEFFVVITSGKGISYGESICSMRNSMGLPGISCNWADMQSESNLRRLQMLEKIFVRNVPTCVILTNSYENSTHILEIDEGVIDDGQEKIVETFQDKLEQILKHTLRLPASEVIDLEQNFSELGVDSLMGLEIGTKIQTLLPHVQVSSIIVQEFPTLGSILAHIEGLLM